MRSLSYRLFVVLVVMHILVPFLLLCLPSNAQQEAEVDAATGDTRHFHNENDATVFDVFGTWLDEQVGMGKKFLETNVFNQFSKGNEDASPADQFDQLFGSEPSTSNDNGPSLLSMAQSVTNMVMNEDSSDHTSLEHLIFTARQFSATNVRTRRSMQQLWELFTTNLQECFLQFKASVLDEVSLERFNPVSIYYFVEREEERTTPSWKRRYHRYHKVLDEVKTLHELHNALYLSQLAYAKTLEDIQHGIRRFSNHSHELIYATTEGFPGEPAHFLALKKESSTQQQPLPPLIPWQKTTNKPSRELEILFVVRGTKELGDALSDGLLIPKDYRNGKVHGGIEASGQFLVKQHIDTLHHLLNVSQRDSIRLTLVGHSLGAGAAAIAAMEFNNYPWIHANSIGFGCPALLNLELSVSTKEYITTVISDADVVPRMSGASMANLFLDIMSYDWTPKGLVDVDLFLDFLNETVFFEIPKARIMDWVKVGMQKNEVPYFNKVPKDRLPIALIPPGTCLHLFRDGSSSGYMGTYTPCEFFQSIEFSRTLVDDHYIPSGYHKAMVSMLRDTTGNWNENFQYDLMAIPV